MENIKQTHTHYIYNMYINLLYSLCVIITYMYLAMHIHLYIYIYILHMHKYVSLCVCVLKLQKILISIVNLSPLQ